MTTGGWAWAATDSGNNSPAADSGGTDINSLEKRFFEHTYPKDTTGERLERLEKMVFGEVRPGNDQERLANLMAAVPAETAPPSDNSASQPSNAPAQNAPTAASNSSDEATADSSDYPTVTSLETEILGASYPQKGIKKRLAALETKAFGKVSSSDDLSERVGMLQSYAAEHDLVPPASDDTMTNNPGFQSSAPGTKSSYPAPTASMPLEAKVAWLEQQVYGSTSTGKPLINRVKRLDKTLLPDEHLDTTESLPENVNTLLNSYQISHNPTRPKAAGIQYANKSSDSPPTAYTPPTYGYNTPSSYGQPAGATPAQSDPYGSPASQTYAPPTDYQAQTNPYQPPTNQTQTTPYQPSYGYQSANANANTQSSVPTQHHSLIHGLAKVLGAVGSMAAGSMSGMGGYGMGYGGYGRPGMGYGGYGMPGMGYGGYGMPGMGYGGYGMPGMGYGGGFPGMHF